jgi:hypothetical protein
VSALLDDTPPGYWGDGRQQRLVCQAQQFAAQCATIARWAADMADPWYTVWCQKRAARAAAHARTMRDLTGTP